MRITSPPGRRRSLLDAVSSYVSVARGPAEPLIAAMSAKVRLVIGRPSGRRIPSLLRRSSPTPPTTELASRTSGLRPDRLLRGPRRSSTPGDSQVREFGHDDHLRLLVDDRLA